MGAYPTSGLNVTVKVMFRLAGIIPLLGKASRWKYFVSISKLTSLFIGLANSKKVVFSVGIIKIVLFRHLTALATMVAKTVTSITWKKFIITNMGIWWFPPESEWYMKSIFFCSLAPRINSPCSILMDGYRALIDIWMGNMFLFSILKWSEHSLSAASWNKFYQNIWGDVKRDMVLGVK